MSLYSHYDLDDAFERAHDRLDDEIAALSERAVKAEAEVARLRKAITLHEASKGHNRDASDDALWDTLDAKDGDE